jgi:hypothetical protein
MERFFWILAFSFVSAQELPCAKLLENLPSSSLAGISTIDLTHVINYVETGSKSTLHYVKDFVTNKAYVEHDLGNGYLVIYRYNNGVGTIEKDGKPKEAPAEEDLVSIRETMELLEFDFLSIFASEGVQSCDGQQSYGDILAGEQVTVSGNGELTSFLLGDTGQFLGLRFYYDDIEGIPLVTFTDFAVKDGLLQYGTIRYYELLGDEGVLREEKMLEVTSYNQELDESLFVPKE